MKRPKILFTDNSLPIICEALCIKYDPEIVAISKSIGVVKEKDLDFDVIINQLNKTQQ